jgi:hypothetical protein
MWSTELSGPSTALAGFPQMPQAVVCAKTYALMRRHFRADSSLCLSAYGIARPRLVRRRSLRELFQQ